MMNRTASATVLIALASCLFACTASEVADSDAPLVLDEGVVDRPVSVRFEENRELDSVPHPIRLQRGFMVAEPSETPATFIEHCSGRWSCTGRGELVFHYDGAGCRVAGDVTVTPDTQARFAKASLGTPQVMGYWKVEGRTLSVVLGEASTPTVCERID